MEEQVFPEFNIRIKNIRGVSPVGEETKRIAIQAAKIKPKTALDMGCGTGFIAIYLKTLGIDAEGADINENALALAKENAEKNNTDVCFYNSDLFTKITKKYDLIIFNAPYGNTGSAKGSKVLEFIKSFIPKGTILTKISYRFIRDGRKQLTKRFLDNVEKHLTENGKIILLMDEYEMTLLEGKKYTILDTFLNGKIVCVET